VAGTVTHKQVAGRTAKIKHGIMFGMGVRGRPVGVALIGAVLLVGGCTGEAGPNRSTVSVASSAPSASSSASPTSSASPSSPASPSSSATSASARPYPADVPLTGHNVKPGEKPPLYPAAARARTQAGANAFAEFFMRTLDWAYATTNPSYMKHYSGPSCGLCSGLATTISKTAAQRHWYVGGRFTIHPATSTTIAPVTAPADYCSYISVDTTAEYVVDRTGTVFSDEGAYKNLKAKLCAKFSDSTWQTTYLARP
jgi:hypothetical protein